MNSANKVWSLTFVLLSMFLATEVFAEKIEQRIVISEIGLSTPESIEYYPAEDVYLVSNINGSSGEADGNGYISKLKPDGSVVDLKWIDGTKNGVILNAPKGSAVVGSNFFVADLNQVQVFALPSGQQKKSITIEGSTFLNGVTPGPNGSVYVTDSGYAGGMIPSGTDALYQVQADGTYKVIAKDKEMGHPNGIWYDNGQLIVNTFGTEELFRLDIAGGNKTALPKPPQGGLDGLVKLQDGRLVLSSWAGSALYVLDKDDKFSMLADKLESPADIGLDTKRNLLLIPLFKENKVVLLPY